MFASLFFTFEKIMDFEQDQILEETKSYILGLCSALGAYDDLPSEDGNRHYSVGDEALGKILLH